MSLRTIVSIAASIIIGIACIVSTDAFATVPHHMTHLDHKKTNHNTVHSGRVVNHPNTGNTGAGQAR